METRSVNGVSPDQLKGLADFFPPDVISWKPGSVTRDKSKGLAMAFVDARAVQNRLDEVCGPHNWKTEFSESPSGGVLCRLSIRVRLEDGTSEWVGKEDGAGTTAVEGEKGGISDAFKRAAVHWGVFRYGYDMPSQWVPLNDKGRFAETPRIPAAFLPSRQVSEHPRSNGRTQQKPEPEPPQQPTALTATEGQALLAHAAGLGLDADNARAVIEGFRDEGGVIPGADYGRIERALNETASVVGAAA